MKSIHTQAIITGIRSKVDKSLGLSVNTPELSSDEKAMFMELQGLNVELLITPKDEAKVEEYKVEKDLNSKPPSVRLRAVLFVFWEQYGKVGMFDDFYRAQMEKFIDSIKEKLS
jgi:hypothetical protein